MALRPGTFRSDPISNPSCPLPRTTTSRRPSRACLGDRGAWSALTARLSWSHWCSPCGASSYLQPALTAGQPLTGRRRGDQVAAGVDPSSANPGRASPPGSFAPGQRDSSPDAHDWLGCGLSRHSSSLGERARCFRRVTGGRLEWGGLLFSLGVLYVAGYGTEVGHLSSVLTGMAVAATFVAVRRPPAAARAAMVLIMKGYMKKGSGSDGRRRTRPPRHRRLGFRPAAERISSTARPSSPAAPR